MASLKAEVVRLKIEEHPNADALELAVIGGYRAVVKKGQFQTGDLAVYIPEQSLVPEWLIQKLGLEGRLSGKEKNRVKAIRLRSTLSQGLVYPLEGNNGITRFMSTTDGLVAVREGFDVTEQLGITKWEPSVPTSMSGQVWNAMGKTLKFDIENWKNYPDMIAKGEPVIFTEKAHGTFCAMGIQNDEVIVQSKGLGGKGLAFKLNEENAKNIYVKTYNELRLSVVNQIHFFLGHQSFMVLGEIFGKGVQDLSYGSDVPQFRIFDIYVGTPNDGHYLTSRAVREIIAKVNEWGSECEYMPVLYEGPFSVEVMEQYTDGKETISGNGMHIREGIVIRTADERVDDEIGRVILKSVSADYLTRKGDATEYS